MVEFDESTVDLWPSEDLLAVDELLSAFDGFAIERVEVVTLSHPHDQHRNTWPMAVVVAQRPVR